MFHLLNVRRGFYLPATGMSPPPVPTNPVVASSYFARVFPWSRHNLMILVVFSCVIFLS